jgi:hypothetical protein
MWKKIIFLIVGVTCRFHILSPYAEGGEDFLSISEYWKRPIPIQVSSSKIQNPKSKLPLSLHPDACGECHKEQYKGWRESLHSKAVGPGFLSQLDPNNDPETALSCYYCHAPMAEQSEFELQSPVASHLSPMEGNYIKNQTFDSNLKLSGVSCSVCHLRGSKVYGPPAKTVISHQPPVTSNKRPHNFEEKDFFESAEFCAACHQLDEGYELNGKVLTNTYSEWKESIYGKDNITCQNCHMPDRQHLWRGIHDPEMVRGGIHIEVIPHKNGGRLVITNSGVGHFFPTYVTPLIVIKGFMLDKKERIILSSLKEAFIGRKVNLDLTQEIFDTRIAPQKTFEFDYNTGQALDADRLVFEVWVYPDEFYNRFYKAMTSDNTVKGDYIKEALMATEKSGYKLFRKEVEIGL